MINLESIKACMEELIEKGKDANDYSEEASLYRTGLKQLIILLTEEIKHSKHT